MDKRLFSISRNAVAIFLISACLLLSQASAGTYYRPMRNKAAAGNPSLTFINSASVGSSVAGTAVSITHGLTLSSGDLVIAVVHANNNGGDATFLDNNGATPFTELSDGVSNSGTRYLGWRIVGGSEPSAYAWTLSISENRHAVTLLQFRAPGGYSVQNPPIDVAPATGNVPTTASSTTIAATSINIGENYATLIGVCYVDGATTFSVEPLTGGTKEEANQAISHRYQLNVSSGATGTKSWTIDPTNSLAAELFSLKPGA